MKWRPSHRFLLTSQVVILPKPHIRWHLSYLHLFCFPSMAIGSSVVTLLFPNKALEQRILGLRKVALEWPWFVLIAVRLCIKKVFWVRTHSEHYRGGGIHVLHWHSAGKKTRGARRDTHRDQADAGSERRKEWGLWRSRNVTTACPLRCITECHNLVLGLVCF